MMKLSPFATALLRTSSVAIIVTAMRRTWVFGSPDLNVSTVGFGSTTPECCAIRAVISAAVSCACANAGRPGNPIAARYPNESQIFGATRAIDTLAEEVVRRKGIDGCYDRNLTAIVVLVRVNRSERTSPS